MPKKRTVQHGGARKGAGRKAQLKGVNVVTAKLDDDTLKTLAGLESKWGESRSNAVRRSIREAGERHGISA